MPKTLILQAVSGQENNIVTTDTFSRLAVDAFYFLHNSVPTELHTQKEFQADLSAAGLILQAISRDVGFLSRQLNDYAYDVRISLFIESGVQIAHSISEKREECT